MKPLSRPKTVPGYVHRNCLGCGEPFTASRSDALCCGASCRQRYKRKCDGITAIAAGPPKTGSMLVPICADPVHAIVHKLTAKRPAKSAAKAKAKPTRSTVRSTTTKKGAKKK